MTLMSHADALQEMLSAAAPKTGAVWERPLLEDCLSRVYPANDAAPRPTIEECYAFVDPSMSGEQSFSAITILGIAGDQKYILYLNDNVTTDAMKIYKFVVRNVTHFLERFSRGTRSCPKLLLFVESNTMNFGPHLKDLFAETDYGDVVHVIKGIHRSSTKELFVRYGVQKVTGDSERFREALTENLVEGTIRRHRDMVPPLRLSIDKMVARLIGQALHVHYEQLSAGAVRLVSKKTLDGKGVPDDLYVSFASALKWVKDFTDARRDPAHPKRGMVRNIVAASRDRGDGT